MRKSSVASGLVIAAASVFLAAMSPACGSPQGGTGFTSSSSGGGSGGTSSGSGSGGQSSSGGSSGSIGSIAPTDASIPPGDNSDAGCAGITAKATSTAQPVYMLFVLDGSGSMQQNNKWKSVTAALNNIFNDMGTKNDPGLAAGLNVFSDDNDQTGGSGPYPETGIDVPIAQVKPAQVTALEARYGGGDGPSGGMPTGVALGVSGGTGAYNELATFVPPAPLASGGKRVLVLITDGVPEGDICDTTSGFGGGTPNYTTNPCITYAASELTLAAANGGPIETFVIGTGIFPSTDLTNFDPSFLGYLAQAGGSGPAGCSPSDNTSLTGLCYFEVDPSGSTTATQTAFETAINAIRGQVVSLSCTFKLDLTDAGMVDPSKVNVSVNGATVPQDPTNGWTYDDPNNPTSVTLHGTSCAEVTSTASASVSIVLGCEPLKTPPQ